MRRRRTARPARREADLDPPRAPSARADGVDRLHVRREQPVERLRRSRRDRRRDPRGPLRALAPVPGHIQRVRPLLAGAPARFPLRRPRLRVEHARRARDRPSARGREGPASLARRRARALRAGSLDSPPRALGARVLRDAGLVVHVRRVHASDAARTNRPRPRRVRDRPARRPPGPARLCSWRPGASSPHGRGAEA